jgi:methionine sulfoxide reductase heme-binding subunit
MFKGTNLIWWTTILSSLMCLFVYFSFGMTEETIRLCIRLTARVSFILFSLAFMASSFFGLMKNRFSTYLINSRRFIGLSFGVSHIIHLINIIMLLFVIYDGRLEGLGRLKKIWPAMLVYIYIFVMMATSNSWAVNFLGTKQWTWLHRLGMYAIAGAFGNAIYKAIDKEPILYISMLAILVSVVGIRFYYTYSTRTIKTLQK